jgi:pimeloyl-ACP methyl ester carboxylesterase
LKVGQRELPADVTIPANPRGVVIFAHGSGSSRLSPRNREVARALNRAAFATVLFDLLTPEEAEDRANIFDIGLLAGRMREAIAEARRTPELHGLGIGLFGASTGAAAALSAAAMEGEGISAVVCRGGRPDLAGSVLADVTAPTLLIVGGRDETVLSLNELALAQLRCEKRLEVVPGASHLFEEPGKMEDVTALASQWFTRHLAGDGG